MTAVRPLTLHTSDGVTLEAELAAAEPTGPNPRAKVVLCHPHPQYGGTMRSIVISALFDALPGLGYPCLRFNFRGVEGSGGSHAEGRDEPLDIFAAIDTIASDLPTRRSCSSRGRSVPTWRCRSPTPESRAGSRSRRRCAFGRGFLPRRIRDRSI